MKKVSVEDLEKLFDELDGKFVEELDEKAMFTQEGGCGTPCGSGGSGYNYASRSPGW